MIRLTSFLAAFGLSACSAPEFVTTSFTSPTITEIYQSPPPGADQSICWGKLVSPAQPRNGAIEASRESWFETPCPADLSPGFIASVQRALAARKLYTGPIDGQLSSQTRIAILKFQTPLGLESSILSVAAARKLGLWTIARPET